VATELAPHTNTAAPATLSAAALEYAKASRSPATLAAYRRDFTHFTSWCRDRGESAIPATPEVVAEYLTDLAAEFKPSTIARRLAAVSVAHQSGGYDTPTRHPAVRAVNTGIRRTHGTAPKEAAALSIGEIRRMIARVDRNTLHGKRDVAIILAGFALAARPSELVAMEVVDITRSSEGLTVRVRHNKRDQEGRGAERVIVAGTDVETCPIIALGEWLAAAAIESGPVFRSVTRHGHVGDRALSTNSVTAVLKQRAAAADLDTTRLSGHSLRVSHVTTAAANGRPEREIAAQTLHAPGSLVLRRYIRHGSRFTENSAKHLGL